MNITSKTPMIIDFVVLATSGENITNPEIVILSF